MVGRFAYWKQTTIEIRDPTAEIGHISATNKLCWCQQFCSAFKEIKTKLDRFGHSIRISKSLPLLRALLLMGLYLCAGTIPLRPLGDKPPVRCTPISSFGAPTPDQDRTKATAPEQHMHQSIISTSTTYSFATNLQKRAREVAELIQRRKCI